MKDIEDRLGDRQGFRTKTLPLQIGTRPSFAIAAVLFDIALILVAVFLAINGQLVGLWVSSPVLVLGIFTAHKLLGAAPEHATQFVRAIKIEMSFLILVVILVQR